MKKIFAFFLMILIICIVILCSCNNANCKTCGDTEKIICSSCNGDGVAPCGLCGGVGSRVCVLCGGTGGRYEYNFMTKMYEYRMCYGGCLAGRIHCAMTIPCSSCTDGYLPCPNCAK